VLPGTTNNVWIRGGFMVNVDGNNKPCKKLFIVENSSLVTNFGTYVGTATYVTPSGDSLYVETGSSFGGSDTTALGAKPAGPTLKICGGGSIKMCRIIPNTTNSTVTFAANTYLTYQSDYTSVGAGLYCLSSSKTITTVNILSGVTVTTNKYSAIYLASGSGTDVAVVTTFNIDGTLTIGDSAHFVLRSSSGSPIVNINSGGMLNVGRNVSLTSTTGTNPAIVTVAGTFNACVGNSGGTADFTAPTLTVTGTGMFTLGAGATMNIGAADGLNSSTGPIQTTTRTFSTAANYLYVGTDPQTTGSDLPSHIGKITINNSAGVTLTNNVTIDSTLTLSQGKLLLGANSLTLGSVATVNGTYSDSAMVVTDGTGELRYNSTAVDTMMFPIGDITGTAEYSPAKIILKSGTGSGTISVRVVNTKHPNDASTSEFLSRYWKVSSAGITNLQADVQFVYTDTDINGAEGSIVLGRYSDGAWTKYGAASTDSNWIVGTVTGFGDFSGVKASIPVAGISYNKTTINFGNVKVTDNRTDTLKVTNIGTDTLRVTSIKTTNPLFQISDTTFDVSPSGIKPLLVVFVAMDSGAITGSFVVSHNVGAGRDTIRLSAYGTIVNMSMNKSKIDFGILAVGAQKKDSVIVTNTGNVPFTISSIISTNSVFTFAPSTLTIQAGKTGALTVTAKLDSAKNRSGWLILTHNGDTSPDSIEVVLKSLTNVPQEAIIPAEFAVFQNYPNPFNPSTTISYALPQECRVSIKIYNILGAEVRTLISEVQTARYYSTLWNGQDNSGSMVSSGLYFYRIIAEPLNAGATNFVQMEKMILLK
jgi:hypothetical protein